MLYKFIFFCTSKIKVLFFVLIFYILNPAFLLSELDFIISSRAEFFAALSEVSQVCWLLTGLNFAKRIAHF